MNVPDTLYFTNSGNGAVPERECPLSHDRFMRSPCSTSRSVNAAPFSSYGNSATLGGAMFNDGNTSGTSNPTLINVIFSGNSADDEGGALYNNGGSSGTSRPTLTNVILWGNTASTQGDQIYNNAGTADLSHSLLEGGCPSGATCSSLLTADPLFKDADGADGTFGTADDNLRLTAFSPGINAGDNTAVPSGITTDIASSPRIYDDTVDLGAYEFQNSPPTITSLADQTIPEDTSTDPLAFTVGDTETAAADLAVAATSSDAALVSDANLLLGGSNADRTIEAVPTPDANGTSTITLLVSDGTDTTRTAFSLTVSPVNDAPHFTAGDDVTISEDAGPQRIADWATANTVKLNRYRRKQRVQPDLSVPSRKPKPPAMSHKRRISPCFDSSQMPKLLLEYAVKTSSR